MNKLVSIAIVNYNNRAELEKCLESIDKTKGSIETEVLVFDNGSSDGSSEMVEKRFPEVRLTQNAENLGLTKAMNALLEKSRGEHILVLDSDTELEADCLSNLSNFLDDNPRVGIVGGRVFYDDGRMQETARSFPNALSGLFGRRALFTRLWPGNPISRHFLLADKTDESKPFEVDYVSAACLMLRREVLQKVGPMDVDYFVYWCDADWCRRAKNAGFSVFCVPSARIVHHERYQPKLRKNPRMIKDFHRGAYLYYTKHVAPRRYHITRYIAWLLLSSRTALHLATNTFKSKEG